MTQQTPTNRILEIAEQQLNTARCSDGYTVENRLYNLKQAKENIDYVIAIFTEALDDVKDGYTI